MMTAWNLIAVPGEHIFYGSKGLQRNPALAAQLGAQYILLRGIGLPATGIPARRANPAHLPPANSGAADVNDYLTHFSTFSPNGDPDYTLLE
jgi:hypothetical protein